MEISEEAFATLLAEIADLKRRLENTEHVVIGLHDKTEVNDTRISALAEQTENLRRTGHQRHAAVLDKLGYVAKSVDIAAEHIDCNKRKADQQHTITMNFIDDLAPKVHAVLAHVMPDVAHFNTTVGDIIGTPDYKAPEFPRSATPPSTN